MRSTAVSLLALALVALSAGCATPGDAAEEVAEKPPAPLPNPPRPTGPLNPGEKLFAGDWYLYDYGFEKSVGTLIIDDRAFHAKGDHGEYRGYVTVDPDASPMRVDFTIEQCNGCVHEGKTSRGIYYVEDDGAIVFAGPEPGGPRAVDYEKKNQIVRIRRIEAVDG